MTEYFRIEGLNLIDFDRLMVTGTLPVYCLTQNRPPAEMSKSMTRAEIVSTLARLPLGVRGHALNRGMSMVTFPFSIQANTDPEMEQALHNLIRTLNEGQLYIESEGARGTRAVLHYKSDDALQDSYKTIYYAYIAETGARDVLGATIKEHYIKNAQITLYVEPKWRPSMAITLGPNQIYCPGLEEDGNADGLADNWALLNAPLAATMESTIVLQGFYSQKVVTGAFGSRGIQSATFVAPAGTTAAVCYAWIARPAAGSNIIVVLYDVTTPVVVASALYDTAGWETETAKDGTSVFTRVVVSSAAGIVAGRTYRLRIYNTVDTGTTYYVDKCYWKWDTAVVPDEWCDHWLIYNHYDTTESAAHVGHQNYFDVADLKGTDDARLKLRVQFDTEADEQDTSDLIIARRSWWDYPSPGAVRTRDVHWLEAEDATTQSNWADLADATTVRCSAGSCVSNAANVDGYCQWAFQMEPVGAGLWGSNYLRGRHDVFGVVYNNDIVNTQYRLSYTNLSRNLTFYNQWVKQPTASYWQLIYLGEINWDKFLRANVDTAICSCRVEYAKDAADTVKLDCIWLLRKTEPETRLHNAFGDWVGTLQYWTIDRTEDFDYDEKEDRTPTQWITRGELCLQGDMMTLTPNKVVGERLYFSCESVDTGPAPDCIMWEAHGVATNLQMEVYAAYLPQYQTPLD